MIGLYRWCQRSSPMYQDHHWWSHFYRSCGGACFAKTDTRYWTAEYWAIVHQDWACSWFWILSFTLTWAFACRCAPWQGKEQIPRRCRHARGPIDCRCNVYKHCLPKSCDTDSFELQASPQKKDLYAWREIFNLYMEAQIFRNETEGQYSPQSYERSQEKLEWFTKELTRMNLVWL